MRINKQSAVLHLSEMIKCETVFGKDEEFAKFRKLLEEFYPNTVKVCEYTRTNDGLVYRWRGENNAECIVLTAHYDVVPAEKDDWLYAPFSGTVTNGEIWGRGAIDMKSTLCAIMESVEALIKQGFKPSADIYLCFGADEETAGESALGIAAELKKRGVKPFLVLDEGGAVLDGGMVGVRAPCALLGIAEKGYMDVELIARGKGGHTSIPARSNPIETMAEAIKRLSKNPFGQRVCAPVNEMLKAVAVHANPLERAILRCLPVWSRFFANALPEISALSGTIGAVTQIEGGNAANVIPERVRAVGNFRIISGSSVAQTLGIIRRTLRRLDVEINVLKSAEPSAVSRTDGRGWALLRRTVRKSWDGAAVIPYLMLAGSDSRSYCELSDAVYRFTPMKMNEKDREMIHGVNEHISLEDFYGMIKFYSNLIMRCGVNAKGKIKEAR